MIRTILAAIFLVIAVFIFFSAFSFAAFSSASCSSCRISSAAVILAMFRRGSEMGSANFT